MEHPPRLRRQLSSEPFGDSLGSSMSYDLFLWREQRGTSLDADVVTGLQDTEVLPGLIPIPRDDVVIAFREQFPDISAGDVELDWEGDGSYFQVGFTLFDARQVSIVA